MNNRQSGFKIMTRLIKVLKPLTPIMMITISFGVLGFLAAIAITTFGMIATATALNIDMGVSIKICIAVIIACGILRGVLRYIEQYSGHFIAFTILAILRDKVFKSLRKLSPAKLERKEKGNLISVITSDIELLEVFYAHTIAPIAIAIITSISTSSQLLSHLIPSSSKLNKVSNSSSANSFLIIIYASDNFIIYSPPH